jgi:hypothetical protein
MDAEEWPLYSLKQKGGLACSNRTCIIHKQNIRASMKKPVFLDVIPCGSYNNGRCGGMLAVLTLFVARSFFPPC